MAEKPEHDRFEVTVSYRVLRVSKKGEKVEKENQGFFNASNTWENMKLPGVLAIEAILVHATEKIIAMGMLEAQERGFKKEIEALIQLGIAPKK